MLFNSALRPAIGSLVRRAALLPGRAPPDDGRVRSHGALAMIDYQQARGLFLGDEKLH
jgi:hypothetical protein